jgi:ABC-type branched-subunit amino acid transport system ATPase component/predicted MFS family arabinose efflux permease
MTDLADLAAGIVDGTAEDVATHVVPDVEPGDVDALAHVGADGDGPTLKEILRKWGARPLAILFALNVLDELDRFAVVTLAPDIRHDLHLTNAALGGLSALGAVIVVTLGLPFGVLADRGRNRPTIAGVAGMLWGGAVLLTSLVRNALQFGGAIMFSGIGKASVEPIHGSLIADYYPPEARGRVYGLHQSANAVGAATGPALAGLIAHFFGWRWVFVVLAFPSVFAGLAALRLKDPGRGRHEADALDTTVDADASEVRVPLMTAIRRLTAIRTLRYLYVGIGLLGFGLISGPTLMSVYFDEHWGVGELGRAAIFSVIAIGSIVGVTLGGQMADRLFRHDPAWPVFLIGASLVLYSAVTALAVWLPALVLVVAVLALATAGVGAATVSIRTIVAAVSPPQFRSLAFAMLGVYIALYGGFLGGVIFGSIADATSPQVALTLLVVPGTLAGALMALGARSVKGDIAEVAADVRNAAAAAQERRSTGGGALLEVRNLDFSYGPVQVLFDVSLDVPEGDIVALLGTNGAGKSTLLRVITGLGHPTRGTVRFDGTDTTYLEAEQLLGLGIAQMPGGKAVFPGLSVVENLRVGAFTFRKDTARVEREIKQVEEWFPILGERRNQAASTLSGGEQQMLAIGKAFLTRPRLLCIDELSLGLAPGVVASRLEIVREMHRRGTTIVIVEQSLNVALTLAETAVFMEKGQVRFVGPARDLLERPDLARSVFLEGAAR